MNFAFMCLSGKLDGGDSLNCSSCTHSWSLGGESGGEESLAMGRGMEKGLVCAMITETWAKEAEENRFCGKTWVCIIVHTAYTKGWMIVVEIACNFWSYNTAALKEEQSVLACYC